MHALITGSNGFLGAWLARRLVARGDRVRCLTRRSSNAESLEGLSVERVEGDITAPSTLVGALKDVDTVFHLAGIRRAPERKAFFQINAEGTRNLCEAMVTSNRARRLVLCGSLAATGPSTAVRPRLESDPFAPREWYGESKAEAERIAFSYSGRLEVTAARPARIVGPGDRENLVFFKLVKKGLRLSLGGGPRPLSMADVEDVVDLLLLLATRPEAVGEAFFVAGPGTLTLEGLQDVVAEALGVRPRTLFFPARVFEAMGRGADIVSRLSGWHLPLNRKLARQLLAPAWTCSTEKAQALLGFQPQRSITDSIKRSAAWYQQRGWL